MLALLGAAGLIVDGLVRSGSGLSPADYALAIVTAAPVLWRTVAPLRALVAVEIGALACAAVFDANLAATGLIMVQLYTVALLGDRRRSIVVGTITAAVVMVAVVLLDGAFDVGAIALRVPLVFIALGGGELVRSRRALQMIAREREQNAARELEREARRKLSEERVQIARELHDTLAHNLVAMNVRAGVALDLREAQDPYAALADVKQASANALRDLRATLNLLRDQDDEAPVAPAHGLDGLTGLIEHARLAGLAAQLDLHVGNAPISSSVASTTFRIVQESLTNILRHADATAAVVTVRTESGALAIEIVDDGTRPPSSEPATGLGLRGMTERAHAVGGTIDTGPGPYGGWRVAAALPLSAGTATHP